MEWDKTVEKYKRHASINRYLGKLKLNEFKFMGIVKG